MDYYKRKELAQKLIKTMIDKGLSDEDIALAVEDNYQLSYNSTMNYLKRTRLGN